MKKHFVSLFLWFLISMPVAISQETSTEKGPKLEKDRPATYVTFECTGSREPRREGESNKGVWLRLHNNLPWALSVPGFAVPTTFASKNQDDEAVLYYEVENTRASLGRTLLLEVPVNHSGKAAIKVPPIPPPPIGYRMGDLVKTISLPSGGSVLFSIPYEHLKREFAISFSFRYEWEEYMDETRHRVYFNGSDIPDQEAEQCR